MTRKQSRFDPPVTGWQRDLPGPNETPLRAPEAFPPNCVDNIYLELSRSSLAWRGVLVWLGMGSSIVLIPGSLGLFFWAVIDPDLRGIEEILMGLAMVNLSVWLSTTIIRMDLSPPRDEPIRFNRASRKVCVYRFHMCWWNPFSRTRWFVRPEAYDWDDLRAEEFQRYAPGVAYQYGVNIVVRKRDINQVRDRFLLSHDSTNTWTLAQVFMQPGPQALPKFERPPRDWNNEAPGMNLARRFAPKVRWPEAMDIESRTAP
ncbi:MULTISPECIES: DUF6708 domain-containing protein [unclassified Pseudoxanthomonas]|uniref:DUF6708 domain-containing protein n=1 Tax=unclassified Pseudoxanthomonas TaxID=2645906 RepID=UPI003076AC8E